MNLSEGLYCLYIINHKWKLFFIKMCQMIISFEILLSFLADHLPSHNIYIHYYIKCSTPGNEQDWLFNGQTYCRVIFEKDVFAKRFLPCLKTLTKKNFLQCLGTHTQVESKLNKSLIRKKRLVERLLRFLSHIWRQKVSQRSQF